MEFSYGQGSYSEGGNKLEGEIILGDHKLYLKSKAGEFTQTFIALDRIVLIKKNKNGLTIHIRPTPVYYYNALIIGEKKYLAELVKDIVKRLKMKKKFFKNEWVGKIA